MTHWNEHPVVDKKTKTPTCVHVFFLGTCQDSWHCHSAPQCIQRSNLCDGMFQCSDYSDETDACGRYFDCVGNYVYDIRYYFVMSPNYIPAVLLCDGVPDCINHYDEINCVFY